jgi:Zn-dependent protease
MNNEISFPQKPVITKKNDTVSKSIINISLFLLIAYFYFNKDIYLVIAVFIVLAIHELGHLFAMRFFNYTDLKIFFIPILGAYASGKKKEISQKQSIVIYLCGPIPGILMGIGLYYYSLGIQSNLLFKTSFIFIIINLFNLLPIKPLDGGNLISTLLIDSNKILQKGFIIISILVMIGVSFYLKSYILLIIPFFMVTNQLKQYKIDKIKKKLAQQGFDLNLSFKDLSDKDYWTIRTEIIKNFKVFKKLNPGILQISEQETKIVLYAKLVTRENVILKDVSSNFREVVLFIFALSVFLSFYYIKAMKANNVVKNRDKTFYEQLSPEDIKMMKEQCINSAGASLGLKLSSKNKDAICNCYVDAILHKYTESNFDNLLKLDKQIRIDSMKKILSSCIIAINDTTNLDSILKN